MEPIILKYYLNLIKVIPYHSLQKQRKEIFFTQFAFTLVELMVTVAIIGVLASIAIPAYQDYMDKAKTIRAISDIEKIGRYLHDYHIDNNGYPASLAEIGADNILDPWGNPYQYLNLSDPNIIGARGRARKDHNLVPINSDFDLYSMGKDGESVAPLTARASRDDIVRANNGRFIDSASQY